MRWRTTALFSLTALSFWFCPQVFAGTVLQDHSFAWSNNDGYLNFENVVVESGKLSGYAWSTNSGWIKFQPLFGGVSNDGAGDLSGFAWGQNVGWIDFDGVSINPNTGKFSGTATGALVGTITFDCPAFCDVQTDWRQVITPSRDNFGGGAASIVPMAAASDVVGDHGTNQAVEEVAPPHIEALNEPLTVLPSQSGILRQDTSMGSIVIEIPPLASGVTSVVSAVRIPISTVDEQLLPKNGVDAGDVIYSIIVNDEQGNVVHALSSPIAITLPVPERFRDKQDVGVYWLNEVNGQWVLIPDAVFSEKRVQFHVNHVSRFAIFHVQTERTKTVGHAPSSLPTFSITPRQEGRKVKEKIDEGQSVQLRADSLNRSKKTSAVIRSGRYKKIISAPKNRLWLIMTFSALALIIFRIFRYFFQKRK